MLGHVGAIMGAKIRTWGNDGGMLGLAVNGGGGGGGGAI